MTAPTYKRGDHIKITYLNYEMTGTVVGHRLIDEEDEVLTEVRLDTKMASTVRVLPYAIKGLTDEVLDGTQGPAKINGNLIP